MESGEQTGGSCASSSAGWRCRVQVEGGGGGWRFVGEVEGGGGGWRFVGEVGRGMMGVGAGGELVRGRVQSIGRAHTAAHYLLLTAYG